MKTFFITGSSRGIGFGLTREVLSHGNKVIAACRRPAEAVELNALAKEHPEHLSLIELDVADASSLKRLASQAAGFAHIDVLINNAGISKGHAITLPELNMDIVEEVFRINTMGPIRVVQALLPALQKASQPVVVQISSNMGSITNTATGGAYPYRIAKAGLNMFNKVLSLESPNVICVVCHPGWVKTDMGGEQADIDVKTSVSGLYKVIRGLKREDSGGFFDYQGHKMPW